MPQIPSDHWLLSPNADDEKGVTIADSPGGDADALLRAHGRWAALMARKNELRSEIDERETANGLSRGGHVFVCGERLLTDDEIDRSATATRLRCSEEKAAERRAELKIWLAARQRAYQAAIEEHGIAALMAECEAIEQDLDSLESVIAAQPARSFADLAVILDVALENSAHGPMSDPDSDWWDFHFVRRVAASAPGFVFAYFRLYYPEEEALDEHGIPVRAPKPGGRQTYAGNDAVVDDAADDALRQECEAVAAAYRAPLPGGDAGLIAAIERHRELEARTRFEEIGFRVTPEIIEPIVTPASDWLCKVIEDTAPAGVPAAAAKLRYFIDVGYDCEGAAEELLALLAEHPGEARSK